MAPLHGAVSSISKAIVVAHSAKVRSALLFMVIILNTCLVYPAIAETVSFLGSALPVDSVTEVDGAQVAVRVGGETFIAKRDEAGRQAGLVYASQPQLARVLPWSTYTRLVGEAGRANDAQFMQKAAAALLKSSDLSKEEGESLALAIASSERGKSLLIQELGRVVPHANPSSIVCDCIAVLPVEDLHELQTIGGDSVQWLKSGCSQRALKSASDELLQGAVEGALARFARFTTFFDTSEHLTSTRATVQILTSLLKAQGERNVEGVAQALRLLRVDPLGKGAFSMVAQVVLSDVIRRSLETGDLVSVLNGLALVDFSIRTPQHHQWLAQALEAVCIEQREAFLRPDIQRMMWAYSSKDDLIKERYLLLLQDFIAGSLQARDVESSTAFLRELVQLRPDPSTANDQARLLLAELLADKGREADYRKALSEVSMGVPITFRLRMALGDLRFIVIAIGALASGAGVAFGIVTVRRRKKRPTLSQKEPTPEHAAESEEENLRDFVAYARDPLLGEEFSEYRECLGLFGLMEGVKLAEIKGAYRNTVKSCHPDLNPNASKEDAQRFIDLTKAYDRLLVLHKERFKGEAP